MTAKRIMSSSLNEAFRAALLLTGNNVDAAEAAVLDGITALGPDIVCRDSRDTLLEETAKSSIQRRAGFLERSESTSLLPLELQRLFLLDPICRQCFVLRILIGLTPAVCSGILCLSEQALVDALYTAFQRLALIETSSQSSLSPFESNHLSSTGRSKNSESRPP
jgi:hypothetical protein